MVKSIRLVAVAVIACFAIMAVSSNLAHAEEAEDIIIKRLTQIKNILKKKPTLEVYAETCLYYGNSEELDWSSADGLVPAIPTNTRMVVTDATFSYTGDDEWAGVTLTGRDSADRVVFRNQLIFVETKRTFHLPMPRRRLLEEGGYVEVGFMSGGPSGTVLVNVHGRLRGNGLEDN